MRKAGNERLLDILLNFRTVKALDIALEKSSTYQEALKQQDRVYERLEKAGLSKEQAIIVERVISAVTHCGAIYGKVAYRLGMQDGVRLIGELKKIK